MQYLIISKGPKTYGGYYICAEFDGRRYSEKLYCGYTLRDAEKLYRKENSLERKHFIKLFI